MAYGLEIGKNEVQILIYTMFADGHVWQGQLDRINELLKLDTTTCSNTQSIYDECKEKLGKINEISMLKLAGLVTEAIDETYFNEQGKRNLLWLMINIAYGNGELHINEKELIEFVADKLKINSSYIKEFKNIAQTLLALMNKQKWAEALPYNEAQEIIKDINKDREFLVNNTKDLASNFKFPLFMLVSKGKFFI